jgi:hypothetical protein
MGVSWPPTCLGKSQRYLELYIYISTKIMTCHIRTFQIYIVWMVQAGHHGPLDLLCNLSSGRKDGYIWLLVGHKQRRVQALWRRIEIVSEKAYSFTVNICVKIVVDTSGFSTALIRSTLKIPTPMIRDLRRRRSRMARNWKSGVSSW